jgi:hypothetical protein
VFGWSLLDPIEAKIILRMLSKESDRAAAIIACTLLEDKLEKRLRSTLRRSEVFDTLFDIGRPLNFFGARNQLAYLLKIYGKRFYQEMDRIGTVRNKFAHLYSDKGTLISDFKSPSIKKIIDQMCFAEELSIAEDERRKPFSVFQTPPSWWESEADKVKGSKAKYLATCAICAGALSGNIDPKISKEIMAD